MPAMPSIPLPFVVALLLLVLLIEVIRRDDRLRAGGKPANLPFLALIGASILQSVLSGLRWGYGVQGAMYLLPVVAALLPPLAYGGVSLLVRKSPLPLGRQLVLHALPAALIVGLMLFWRDAVDMALVAVFVIYAAAILFLMRPGADALRLMPLENATPAYRSIIFAAVMLLLSALLDLYVFLDIAQGRGSQAIILITMGNLAGLIALSVAATIASRSPSPVEEDRDAPAAGPVEGDREIMATITAQLEGRKLYHDAELTLDRLARKTLIPARQISGAINRSTGKNVSQYVNEFRIAEACDLLATSDKPVTEIMFDVGFQTKSNFNREFRRVTDMAPVQWRETRRRETRLRPPSP